jgi:hypothetical protein
MGNHSCILLLVSSNDLLYPYSTWPFATQFWVSNVPTWSILCRSSGLLEEVLGVITLKFGVAFVGFQRGGRDILQLSCGWALWTNPRGWLVVEQRPGISDQLVHQTKNSFHFVSVWFLVLDWLIIFSVFYWFARPGWDSATMVSWLDRYHFFLISVDFGFRNDFEYLSQIFNLKFYFLYHNIHRLRGWSSFPRGKV